MQAYIDTNRLKDFSFIDLSKALAKYRELVVMETPDFAVGFNQMWDAFSSVIKLDSDKICCIMSDDPDNLGAALAAKFLVSKIPDMTVSKAIDIIQKRRI